MAKEIMKQEKKRRETKIGRYNTGQKGKQER